MAVSGEVFVVGEQKQQVKAPQQHVELHESDHGHVPGRVGWAEAGIEPQQTLEPQEKPASRTNAKEVVEHDDREKADRGGHEQILRPGHHFAVLHHRRDAEAAGVILEAYLDPPRPDEKRAEHTEQGGDQLLLREESRDQQAASGDAKQHSGQGDMLAAKRGLQHDDGGVTERHRQ